MTALDLELPDTVRASLDPVLVLAEREWAEEDVATGTASRTLRALAATGLDRLALVDADVPAFFELLLGVASAFPSAAVVLSMHAAVLHLAASTGTDAQRARVIGAGHLFGFGAAPPVDEPRAHVARVGDRTVLRGALRRVSGAGLVDGFAALVPYGDKGAVLLVEASRPGVHVDPSWESAGLRASSTRRVRFDDVPVDKGDVVALVSGAEDLASWETAMLGLSAISAGIARRAALLAVAHARAADPAAFRAASGSALAATIEEATAALGVTRALAARARRGVADRVALLGAKAATASMAERAVATARAVVGMGAFEPPHPLERLSRDVLGVRHFFPVAPVANQLVFAALGVPDAAAAPSLKDRGSGGSPGRRS